MKIPRYETACFKCGIQKLLMMIAHRNDKDKIVGWIFVCGHCFGSLAGKQLEVKEREE